MNDTLTVTESKPSGIGIPREDYDLLTTPELRAKYPEAFNIESRLLGMMGDVQKAKDAAKVPLHVMVDGGYLRQFSKRGKSYCVVDITSRQEMAIHQIYRNEIAKPETEQMEDGEMIAFICGKYYLKIYDEEIGEIRSVKEDEMLDTFKMREMNAIIAEGNGASDEGENPPE